MSQYRQLFYGQPVPESFFAALQEFICSSANNLALTLAPGSANQVQVVAGTGNNQVGIGIDGLWRYNTATVTTLVAGAAGTYDLYVTCSENDFVTNPSPPPPENDNTDYSFSLASVPTGSTPGAPHSRLVGQTVFDGTRIVALRQMVGGEIDGQQLLQPGMIQTSAAATVPPGWLLCNGIAYPRTTYAALYAALGGPNSPWGQGDGSSTFNVPNLQGRVMVGAGTAIAAQRTLGQGGGAETVQLTWDQSGVNGYGSTGWVSNDHTHYVPSVATGWMDRSNPHNHGFVEQVWRSGPPAGWTVKAGTDFSPGINQASGTSSTDINHLHYTNPTNTGGISQNHNHGLNARNADTPHENMPPFAVVQVIVKT